MACQTFSFDKQATLFLAASLPLGPHLAKLFQTVDGHTRALLISAKPELMVPLDIFQLKLSQNDVSFMCGMLYLS